MIEIKVLKHSVVIKGMSFEECKAEYDRICAGVKEDFSRYQKIRQRNVLV